MIYFDNSATTKPCGEALEAMRAALEESWGNPSSAHSAGDGARRIINDAAKSVAAALGIKRSTEGKIIFTSGGTESNNLAMLGAVRAKSRPVKNGSRGSIIITEGEHASVENTAAALEKEGFNILRIPTAGGALDLGWLSENVPQDTVYASVMLVNNETGAVYDVKSASKIIKEAAPSAVVHSDCVQAFLKMRFTPRDLGVDMVSVSAHKIFSAKGAGALFVNQDVITAKKLVPIVFGGGQGDGFRSGTEAVPAIAGFGAAAAAGLRERSSRTERLSALSDYAVGRLSALDGVRLNLPEKRLSSILSATVDNIKSETMLNFLSAKGICVSKSSACSTHSRNLSRALLAFGLSEAETDSTLRISFSHLNTEAEIDSLCEALEEGRRRLAGIKKRQNDKNPLDNTHLLV